MGPVSTSVDPSIETMRPSTGGGPAEGGAEDAGPDMVPEGLAAPLFWAELARSGTMKSNMVKIALIRRPNGIDKTFTKTSCSGLGSGRKHEANILT
jgi:hypothetical protein